MEYHHAAAVKSSSFRKRPTPGLSPIYTMKKSLRHATHDMSLRHATAMADISPIYTMKKSLRHATAMADLYYFVASPVQQLENTHD